MATADAVLWDVPASTQAPTTDRRPKIRLDLSPARMEDRVLVDIDVTLDEPAGLGDLIASLRELGTAANVLNVERYSALAVMDRAAPEWSASSLTSAFRGMQEDYDVAGTEELSLLATKSYGW